MRPEDIESGDYLAEWLRAVPTGTAAERDRAHRLAVAIAHRAAMRVLPVILDSAPSQKPGVKEQLFFRLNLTAGVAAMGSRLKVARAIERAAAIANTAHTASTNVAPDKTRHATSSATNATRCAVYAASLDFAASEALGADLAAAVVGPDPDSDAIKAYTYTVRDAAGHAGHAADDASDAGHFSSGDAGSLLSALRTDCAAWEAGRPPESMPLWPGENPLHDLWAHARAALLADGPGWAFWVDWYDKALAGEPQDWAGLLSEVALIPPEDWDRDADQVNARIQELQLKHAVKATPLAQAAIADFTFDDLARVMRMVGFDDDTAHIRDPEQVRRFRDDLDEVREAFQDFVDFTQYVSAGSNQAQPLRRGAEKVLHEFERVETRGTIRAARLIDLGHTLHRMSLEPDKRAPLGEALAEKLERNVDLLLRLCRKHFGPSLVRLEPLGSLELGDVSPDALMADLRKALDAVTSSDGTGLARMDQEAQAAFRDMLEEIKDICAALDGAWSASQATHLRKRFAKSAGAIAITMGRYVEKAAPYGKSAGEWVDWLSKNFKRVQSLQDLWEWIVNLGIGPPAP